jgi:type I restriction enzyme M protein
MKDRVLRDFSQDDLNKITQTYHNWQTTVRAEREERAVEGQYQDIPAFCKSATLPEIQKHDYVLTPGRYVGAADVLDDGEAFAEKMARLTAQLKSQFEQSDKLEAEIKKNLAGLGYEI